MTRFAIGLILLTSFSARLVFPTDDAQYRHPNALAINDSDTKLLTANSKSGSISVVDLHTGRVSENLIGGSPRDIVSIGKDHYVVVDFDRHQLIEFKLGSDDKVKIIHRVPVAKYPHRVIHASESDRIFVSSLWSRRVTCLTRTDQASAYRTVKTIDFEFAPREMVFIGNKNRMIVGSNFGGRLAVVNCDKNVIESVHRTTGHNIRGLGMGKENATVLVSHQMLNELAHTSRNDIHWGLLMSNDLRWIKTDAFLQQESELYQSSHMHPLGKEGHAAGDPGRLAFSGNHKVVVTISGTNEIAFGREEDFWLKRVKVGRRPVDVKIDSNSRYAYVANSFDDSISVFDLQRNEVSKTISLGRLRPLSQTEQGEQLFFDASISHDGWMSCHSCHTDGHTNGALNDNFTDGSFGAPKQVLSLLGRKDTEPLAWNGKTASFEQQIRNSIASTMKSKDEPEDKTVKLLTRYVESLSPPPSLASARDQLNTEQLDAGRKIFNDFGCASCHQPPTFTTPETYDVGLKDELGKTQFNPPSLLGVSQRTSFFHDSRGRSLTEVVTKYRHKIPDSAKEKELKLLIRFLQSL